MIYIVLAAILLALAILYVVSSLTGSERPLNGKWSMKTNFGKTEYMTIISGEKFCKLSDRNYYGSWEDGKFTGIRVIHGLIDEKMILVKIDKNNIVGSYLHKDHNDPNDKFETLVTFAASRMWSKQ